MKRVCLALLLAVIATISLSGVTSADTNSSTMASSATIVTPDSLQWTPVTGVSGASMAVVYGDPTKAGSLYTVRMKLNDGTKVPLHWHDDSERVTVLSGTLMFAVGNTFDTSKMTALAPGSFVGIPAHVPHYAMAKGDTVLQVTGNGPMKFNMVK